ncbi:MAG: SH3 domain-containing protein, partial [Peptococcaceae bacterium]|nr:SH3 domain-containing protein [Peptococcaceae bacterium]
MKKLLCLIMAFMMILTSVSAMADPAKVQTPSGPLNMRSEPDTNKGKVIKQIKNGATVTVLEQVDEDWTKVSYSGKEGYVQTRFLNLTVAAEGKTIYADASDHLYLRQKKSDTAKIVGYVSYTQPLTILEVDDEWT